MASDTLAPSKTREKVALKPGFHLIDWMNLMKRADVSGRKGAPLRRISMKEVREHKSRYDCWTVYNKKVYNITNYMDYHPGGVQKLMLGAGKDCTDIFNRYHAWVNCDQMLSKCLVGYLIEEEETIEEGEEEEEEEEDTQECKDTLDYIKQDTGEKESENKDGSKGIEVQRKRGAYGDDSKDHHQDQEKVAAADDDDDEQLLLRAQAKLSIEMPCDI